MIRFGNEYAVSVWRRHQTRHSYAEGTTCAAEAVHPDGPLCREHPQAGTVSRGASERNASRPILLTEARLFDLDFCNADIFPMEPAFKDV